MKFNSGQCVQINNLEELKKAYPCLRTASKYSFEEWVKNKNFNFPVFLENAYSVTRGESVGIIYEPVGTWSKSHLEIISLESCINN